MGQQPLRVLLADDEASLREPLAKHLRQAHGYKIDTAADGQEVLTWLEWAKGQYDVALIDDLLVPSPGQEPEPLGLVLTREIKARYPSIEIILFTGREMKSGLEALQAGAYRYLTKPFNLEELGMLIQTAAEHNRLKGAAREKQILEQLMRTSPALLSGRSLPEVLDVILNGVQGIGFDRICLYLLSEDRQMMVGQAQVGMEIAFVGHQRPVATDAQMQILLADPRLRVFEREGNKPLPYEGELAREGVNQWACVPLILRGEVIGKLSIDNKFSQRPIVEAELEPVALFASQAAAAIENARLRNKELEATQKAERRARQLEVLHQINTHISSALNLEGILQVTLEEGLRAIRTHEGSIMLVNPTTKKLEIKAWIVQGEFAAGKSHRKLAPGEGIAGYVATTGKAYNCPDVSKDTHFVGSFTKRRFHSLLSVPIASYGRVLGTINADSTESHFFKEDDAQFLSALADHVATAIEAQRLRDLGMVLSTLSVDEMLAKIVESACALIGTEFGDIFLIHEESGDVVRVARFPASRETKEGPRKEGGLTARIKSSGEPIVISDAQKDPRVRQSTKDRKIASLMGVPLKVRDEHHDLPKVRTIGVLFVDAMQQREFGSRDVELLQSLANQAAIAIEKTRLYEEVARERDHSGWLASQLLALHEITKEMQVELDLPNLLNLISRLAAELLGADAGGILLLDEARQHLTFKGAYGLSQKAVEGTRDVVGSSIAGRVVKTGEPIIADDIPNDSRFYNPAADAEGWLAIMSTPLRVGGKIIGTLDVHSKSDRHAFDEDDLQILSLMANQAAIAIENVRLFQQTSQRALALEALHRTSLDITSRRQMPELVRAILERAVELLQAKGGGLYLLDESGNQVRVAAISNLPEHLVGTSLEVEEGIIGYIIKNRISLFVPDYRSWPHRLRQYDEYGFTAVAGIPIARQDKIWGVLAVHDNVKGRTFSQEDLNLLSHFGNLAAVALGNAELAVRDSQQKDHWARLVASSPNGVIAIDREGNITGFNEQAQRILKYHFEDVLGQPVNFLYENPQEPRRVGKILHTATDGKLANYESFIRSQEGERIPIRLAATWLYDVQGNQIGSVGYFEDLRSIKAVEQRLELLLKASNTVAQAGNLSDSLQSLAEMVVTFLNVSFCRCFLLDESHQILLAKAAYPTSPQRDQLDWDPGREEQLILADWPLLAEVLAEWNPKVLRIDDKRHCSFLRERSRGLGLKQDIQSLFLVPLKARNKVVGLLALAELRPWTQVPFSKQKQELAVAIADQVAMLIDRIHLYETRDRHRQLLIALERASRHIRAEKETFKLLQEVVRLAAELVGCTAGGLFINFSQLKELALHVTYELPTQLIGKRLLHTEGLIGHVARTGQPKVVHDYSDWSDRENILEAYHFRTVAGVPLKQASEVEAVLFVADNTGLHRLTQTDLEILECFAAQASIALETSRLLSREQRMVGQLVALHKIGDYIQAARDLDKILHVVLTGITAGYGLRFNRAALFLLDEWRENLVGRMGIGHLDELKAREDWMHDQQRGLYDFGQYLDLFRQGSLPTTPVGERIRGLRLPVRSADTDVFWQVVLERRCILVTEGELDKLSGSFIDAFEPDLPLIVAPLLARDQVIGLLVADNKFTRSPITLEDIDAVLTFANAAAIAIDNIQLFHETEVAREGLRSFYEASNTLVSSRDPEQVLQDIVERARVAANANGVSIFLIDQIGQARYLITVGIDEPIKFEDLIRPNGLSMQVMRSGQPEIIEDANKERDRVNPSVFWRGIAAALCLPVSLEGRRVGVMWVHYKQSRRFSKSEIEALQLYVNQAAIAYENARRMDELEGVRRAAEALAGAAGLSEVLEQIIRSTFEVLQADSVSVSSYDAVRGKFTLKGSVVSGIPSGVWRQFCPEGSWYSQTDAEVIERGWVGVEDIDNEQEYAFLEKWLRQFLQQVSVQSFQGIALNVGDEKLGVLYVNYSRPCSFRVEDQQRAQTFATHAALALKEAQLLDRAQKARDIVRVVAALIALGNLEDTLNSIVGGTLELLDCDVVTLWPYDPTRNEFNFPPKMRGVRYPEKILELRRVDDKAVIHKILPRNALHIAEDRLTDSVMGGLFAEREGLISSVGIPLGSKNYKVGGMIISYRKQHHFTAEEIENIELFAYLAAVAIRNAQLYDQSEQDRKRLDAVARISREAAESLEITRLLRTVCHRLEEDLAEKQVIASIRLYDHTRNILIFNPDWHESFHLRIDVEAQKGRTTQQLHEGICGWVATHKQAKNIKNVNEFSNYLQLILNTQSELCVPICRGEDRELVGVLDLQSSGIAAFSEGDQKFLETLADQLAVAVHKAQLYERVERRVGVREALYRASHAVTSSLDLNEILNRIVEQARLLTRYRGKQINFACIRLVEGMRSWTVATYPQEKLSSVREICGEERDLTGKNGRIGIMGRAAKTGEPQLVNDISTDPDYLPCNSDTHSELAMPIKFDDRVIGVISVEHPENNAFDEEDQQTLQALAAQAAIAIQNARLFEEVQRRARLLDAAAKVARDATATLEINELLNETARLISERFGFYHTGVFLLDDKREYAVLQATYPQTGYGMLKIGYKLKVGQQGIVGFVTQTGKYHLALNVAEDSYHLFNPELPHTQSETVFPLIVHGRVIGALDAQSEKVVSLRDEDIATLQTMADQLANAIHNAQLYRQVSERLEEANTLQQVAVSLAGASELNEVLSLIFYGAMKLTNTLGISILLWDAQLEKFAQALRIDEDGTLQLYTSRARPQGGHARKIMDEQKPIIIFDAQQVPDFNPAFLEKGYRASLGVPLLYQGEAIGVLYVYDKEPRQFSDRQVALLEALASQAAEVIDRARRYEELKHTKGLVGARTAVAWMGMVSSTWRHAIEGHALTIREEVAHVRADSPTTYLDKIEKRLAKIERLAWQVLDKPITPPLSEEEGVESVPVNELLRERLRQLWQNEPYKSVQRQVDLKLEETVTVRASPEWLRRIFDVLADNAVEAMADISPQALTISTRAVGSNVEIVFADNGKGISEDVLPKLFHEQIEKPKGTKGLGMGLLMTQTIAQTYGGEIQVESTSHAGTRMVVSLPIEIQKGMEGV